MRLKVKSKDDIIDELEDRNIELFKSYCDLKLHNFNLESQNKDLEQELSEVRERYADLLNGTLRRWKGR